MWRRCCASVRDGWSSVFLLHRNVALLVQTPPETWQWLIVHGYEVLKRLRSPQSNTDFTGSKEREANRLKINQLDHLEPVIDACTTDQPAGTTELRIFFWLQQHLHMDQDVRKQRRRRGPVLTLAQAGSLMQQLVDQSLNQFCYFSLLNVRSHVIRWFSDETRLLDVFFLLLDDESKNKRWWKHVSVMCCLHVDTAVFWAKC